MSSIFWGLRLEPGKRYSTIVDKSFHVSKAALDCSSVKNDGEIVSVMLEEGESRTSFILCNLQKSKELQSNLDLNFMSGDQVTFFCKGSGVVHLSGYIILEDEDELGGLGEEEEEDEDDEEAEDVDVEGLKNQLNGIAQKRKKSVGSKQGNKKLKIGVDDEDDSDEDEDDDDEDEDDDDTTDLNISGIGGSDDEEDDDSDEDEDDDDDEEGGESEEEDEEPPKQQLNQKQKKGKGLQNQLSTPGSKPGTPGDKQKTLKGQQKTPNQQQQQQQQSGKKDKKKGETPKQQLNKSASEDGSTPQKSKPTTVQGGVVVKDIKIGNGPVCKNGKMVTVYYTGRLKSNNKVFDSTTQGSGFQFRLGKGEVIRGWDVGLQGMKVGGKRMITCPPQMAYGQKGSPPTIPGNSTLTFEVELRGVN